MNDSSTPKMTRDEWHEVIMDLVAYNDDLNDLRDELDKLWDGNFTKKVLTEKMRPIMVKMADLGQRLEQEAEGHIATLDIEVSP